MEITDAEWQWDRRKLTFFYLADQRVDFRELVRELFRLYKTRIWMYVLSSSSLPISPSQRGRDTTRDGIDGFLKIGAVWIKIVLRGISSNASISALYPVQSITPFYPNTESSPSRCISFHSIFLFLFRARSDWFLRH